MLINSLESVTLPNIGRKSCAGIVSATIFALSFVALALISPLLNEQADIVEKTRAEICKGNLDFVARVDQSGILAAAPTLRNFTQNSYFARAMEQLIVAERWEGKQLGVQFSTGAISLSDAKPT